MPLLLILFILLFQGCGNNENRNYTTDLGDGASVERTDTNSIIANDSLNKISTEIANMLKANIVSFNKNEEIAYTNETQYCDISGIKASSLNNKTDKINNSISYSNCQEQESLQHGKIHLEYMETNSESKCPTYLNLTINETYTFNEVKLSKDVIVESNISYDANNKIKQLNFKINGTVSYKNENYNLQNIRKITNY
ncbi:MAG TPA: hypothetical protein ENK94_04115 [Campylobacterales bacterium]|nr:hypothetical protein [Campylobacterales bacterium]